LNIFEVPKIILLLFAHFSSSQKNKLSFLQIYFLGQGDANQAPSLECGKKLKMFVVIFSFLFSEILFFVVPPTHLNAGSLVDSR
jgi:hypothetical protein